MVKPTASILSASIIASVCMFFQRRQAALGEMMGRRNEVELPSKPERNPLKSSSWFLALVLGLDSMKLSTLS
jgi:hypothetical protein